MTKLYVMETTFDTYLKLTRSTVDITYNVREEDLSNFTKSLYEKVEMDRPSPAATLVLKSEEFDADYFKWCGSIFVSERMRAAMALSSATAQFLEVDDSESAPLARSKNYQIMEPEVTERVSDPKRSEYRMMKFLPGMPSIPSLYGRMALRADAAPKHDLFYDAFFTDQLLCLEAFASRVLNAGCTGMEFKDPNGKVDTLTGPG